MENWCGSGIRNGGVLAAVWAPAAPDRGQVWPPSLPHATFDFGGGKAVPREGLMWPPGVRGAPAPDALSTRARVCRIDGPTPNNRSRSASMEKQLQSLGACWVHDLLGKLPGQMGRPTHPCHQLVGLSVAIRSNLNCEGPGQG